MVCIVIKATDSDLILDQSGMPHRIAHAVMLSGRQRSQRQAQTGLDQAELGTRPLDRNRVGLDEQLAVQRQQQIVDFPCSLQVPLTAATHISCISFGATLAVTEITPWPPSSMKGMADPSSPL
jgi:hypothetical protein